MATGHRAGAKGRQQMNLWTLLLLLGVFGAGAIFGVILMGMLILSGRISRAEEAREVR